MYNSFGDIFSKFTGENPYSGLWLISLVFVIAGQNSCIEVVRILRLNQDPSAFRYFQIHSATQPNSEDWKQIEWKTFAIKGTKAK